MNYHLAKIAKNQLELETKAAGDRLKSVAGVGTGPMGLTPDHVKASPEYQEAKTAFDQAFARQREFNEKFLRQFKVEVQQERRQRQRMGG